MLGQRLRELRQQAGLTGRQVAESLSWPASKVSKLENGRQTPTDDDIRGWASVTHAEAETESLLASLHTLEVQHAEWQRQLKTGLRPHQDEIADLDAKTHLFRAFEPTFIPGLLQTAEYARARFAQSITVFKVPNDIDEAVRARVRRQEMLYRPDKRFHFILTEATLRYRLCPPEVMLGQLDRLITFAALPNVRVAQYYRANGLPEPYDSTARRKIVPETLEQRVLEAFAGSASLFRKTSCAVSYAHGLPDYNGH